jgi:hypothetical protein
MLDSVELFFTTYKNTAWAFFAGFAFIVTLGKIHSIAAAASDRRAKKLIDEALMRQRQDNQAQVIDRLVICMEEQAKENRRYCDAVSNQAKSFADLRASIAKYPPEDRQ